MLNPNRSLILFLIAGLLAGCAGRAAPAPTLPDVPAILLTYTPAPASQLAPVATPVLVLPDPSTPGGVAPQPSATLASINTGGPMIVYKSQGGDTLEILGKRFGVGAHEIISGDKLNLPAPGVLLQPGLMLLAPNRLPDQVSPGALLIPDSEIVYSPSTIGFNVDDYVREHGGHLASYSEYLMSYGPTSGAQAVKQISLDNSLNPRLILALIEYESHWVLGQPTNLAQQDYPLGYVGSYSFYYKGLFRQLMWATAKLSEGYYQWRSGRLTELTFGDGSRLRLNPRLNAGTAALQYFFSLTHDRAGWEQAVSENGFAALYRQMYGDPWERAKAVEPMIPAGLTQPALTLPFERGQMWAFTHGPHTAWQEPDGIVILEGGALAALDFAPAAERSGCILSNRWVVAPADGVVVRTGIGVVVLDLDGDGQEQTGWDLFFMHIALKDSVKLGDVLQAGSLIGHPSCTGGVSYGTHLHLARKYNGEWMLAAGPIPFDMDGWIAHSGDVAGEGTLLRDGLIVEANSNGPFETRITRNK